MWKQNPSWFHHCRWRWRRNGCNPRNSPTESALSRGRSDFRHNSLVGFDLRNDIRIFASGKITTGFDIINVSRWADFVIQPGNDDGLGLHSGTQMQLQHLPGWVTTWDLTDGWSGPWRQICPCLQFSEKYRQKRMWNHGGDGAWEYWWTQTLAFNAPNRGHEIEIIQKFMIFKSWWSLNEPLPESYEGRSSLQGRSFNDVHPS